MKESIIKKVKSFEDACGLLGIDPEKTTPTFPEIIDPKIVKASIAFVQLSIIGLALNEGWNPNWNDSDQRKWYPWFRVSSSGFAFSGAGSDDVCPAAGDASRLCFKSDELATYSGKQFVSLYESLILN
jgi:hypothetical protein